MFVSTYALANPEASIENHLSPQFARPSTILNSEEQFIVRLPTEIEGACISYYAYNTPDQATIIIPWQVLSELAAPSKTQTSPGKVEWSKSRSRQAQRLIEKIQYGERNYWGCATITTGLEGIEASLIFDLLESGSVVVINDSISQPVNEIIVKYLPGLRGLVTYSLSNNSKPFLTKDPQGIEHQAEMQESFKEKARLSIDNEPRNERDQEFYGFLRKFVDSCTNGRSEVQQYYLSHIGFPFQYKFSVVTDEGKFTQSKGTIPKMKLNESTRDFSLPLCIGDGGLNDVAVRRKGDSAIVDITFGSGPNEKLRFTKRNKKWTLVAAEWIDH